VMILGLALYWVLPSCARDEDPIGGKGGNAVLNLHPRHHALYIDSCTVYIKYNASEKPSSFDDSVECTMVNGVPTGTFSGLKPGNYFVYGKGWDTAIQESVVGGIPYKISEEKTFDIDLPITEAGQH